MLVAWPRQHYALYRKNPWKGQDSETFLYVVPSKGDCSVITYPCSGIVLPHGGHLHSPSKWDVSLYSKIMVTRSSFERDDAIKSILTGSFSLHHIVFTRVSTRQLSQGGVSLSSLAGESMPRSLFCSIDFTLHCFHFLSPPHLTTEHKDHGKEIKGGKKLFL